jgi:hypothetical protein
MNDAPPPNPPPSDPPPAEPTIEYEAKPRDRGDGCLFAAAIAGGFIAFFIGGFAAIASGGRSQTLGILYLVLAFASAVWLAFKPAWRGFAIGVLLGLGALLLLIAICGGFGR